MSLLDCRYEVVAIRMTNEILLDTFNFFNAYSSLHDLNEARVLCVATALTVM
jgi:hypothetical protein